MRFFSHILSGSADALLNTRQIISVTVIAGALALAGCGGGDTASDYPGDQTSTPRTSSDPEEDEYSGGLLDGLDLFGSGSSGRSANERPEFAEGTSAGAIGVNSFLWRASLDTVSFMPLASADPFGGVIITDWYSNPQTPDERFKLTVYILDKRLRADGIRVAVFRQERAGGDNWADAPVALGTATKLENAILTRARQLRIDTLDYQE